MSKMSKMWGNIKKSKKLLKKALKNPIKFHKNKKVKRILLEGRTVWAKAHKKCSVVLSKLKEKFKIDTFCFLSKLIIKKYKVKLF